MTIDFNRRRLARAHDRDLRELAAVADTVQSLLTGRHGNGGVLARAHHTVIMLMSDGMPAGGDAEPVSGGDVGRPTEAAMLRNEGLQRHLQQQHDDLVALRKLAHKIHQRAVTLAGHAVGADESSAPRTGQSCRACERWVTCTSSDTIRSGYCTACYMRWLRRGRPDRARFEADTRADLYPQVEHVDPTA